MTGIKFTERITIRCSPEEAFDFSQDYTQRLHWDRSLKKVKLQDKATRAGAGIKVHWIPRKGLTMITEYVSYQRPITAAMRMVQGPIMFKDFFVSWNFKNQDPQSCEVIFLYIFELRFPFTIFKNSVQKSLQKKSRKRLEVLKATLENRQAEAV